MAGGEGALQCCPRAHLTALPCHTLPPSFSTYNPPAPTPHRAEPTYAEFAQQIKATQDAYVRAKRAGDVDGMKTALFQVDETQSFWFVPTAQIWRTDYDHLDHEPLGGVGWDGVGEWVIGRDARVTAPL